MGMVTFGVDGVVLGDGDVRAPRHHVDGGDVGCGLGARGLELVIDGREQRSVGVALPRRHADEHHDVEGHVVGGFRVRARRGLGSRCRRRPERARGACLQEPRHRSSGGHSRSYPSAHPAARRVVPHVGKSE